MYLSFGAILELIGVCYHTGCSVSGPTIISGSWMCLVSRCMQDASRGIRLVLAQFLARTAQPRPSCFGLFNYNFQAVDSPTSRRQQQVSSAVTKNLNHIYKL